MHKIMEKLFTLNNLNIIIPSLLVICAFGLKIFRKSPLDLVDFLLTLFELPMDIIILALGYISSYICSDEERTRVGFGVFTIEIVISIFIFGFCKSSCAIFQSTNRTKRAILKIIIYCLLAYVLAVASYCISVSIYGGK